MHHHNTASFYLFVCFCLFVYEPSQPSPLSTYLFVVCVFIQSRASESAGFVTLFSLCKQLRHSQDSFSFLLPDIRWFIGVPLISLGFKTVKQPVYVSTLHEGLAWVLA